MTTRRGTTNRNQRGGSRERRIRRAWLVNTYGDGLLVLCFFCRTALTVNTVSADRIRPGVLGGGYARPNIRPACVGCNSRTGGVLGNARRWGTIPVPAAVLTTTQRRRWIEVRCHPSGVRTYGGHQRRTIDRLAELGLVHVQRRWIAGRLALEVEPLGEGVSRPVALTLDLVVAG